MGVPTADQYAAMLDAAASGGYAYPAINVTPSQALNAAIRGFAEAGSDGIVQVTTGAAPCARFSPKAALAAGAASGRCSTPRCSTARRYRSRRT